MTLLWLCRLVSGRGALAIAGPSLVVLVLTHTRTALLAMIVGLLVAGASLLLARRRVRRFFAIGLLVVVVVGTPATPLLAHWLARGESAQGIHDLTGRTKAWSAVLAVHRPATNVIFGDGLSNDAVIGSSDPAKNGLPIDDSWLSIYQDQGIVGDVLVGAVFLVLVVDGYLPGTRADAGGGALSDRLLLDRRHQRNRLGRGVAVSSGFDRRGITPDPSLRERNGVHLQPHSTQTSQSVPLN